MRRYAALSPGLKLVMQMKSLLLFGTRPQDLLSCLRAARSKAPPGVSWTLAGMTAAHAALRREGLLDEMGQGHCPDSLLHPITLDAFASPDREKMIAAIVGLFPTNGMASSRYFWPTPEEIRVRLLRNCRLALYLNDEDSFASRLREGRTEIAAFDDDLVAMLGPTRLPLDWIETRAGAIQAMALAAALSGVVEEGSQPDDAERLAQRCRARRHEQGFEALGPLLLRYDTMACDLDALRQGIADHDGEPDHALLMVQGALAFLEGRHADAAALYRDALRRLRRATGRRTVFLPHEHRLFYPLAMLGTGNPAFHADIEAGLKLIARSAIFDNGAVVLHAILALAQGEEALTREILTAMQRLSPLDMLTVGLLRLTEYWQDQTVTGTRRDTLRAAFERARHIHKLSARIHAQILVRTESDPTPYQTWLDSQGGGIAIDFVALMATEAPWERAVGRLSFLLQGESPAGDAKAARGKRLAWFIDPEEREIEVLEQSAKGKTGWTDGRPVALKRLYEHDARLDYLTEQDRRVIGHIVRDQTDDFSSFYARDVFSFDFDRTVPALVGHPVVFDSRHRARRLELVSHPLELTVTSDGPDYRLALSHFAEAPTVFVEAETPTRYRVVEFHRAALEAAAILGESGLRVPAAGRDRVIALVKAENPRLPIRAEIAEAATVAEGEATPVVQLAPLDGGLKLSIVVRPFGSGGPAFVAGLGARSALATIDGGTVRANRDLKRETEERAALVAACPTLRDRLGAETHDLAIDDLDGALELLLELGAYTGPLAVEWPEGRTMRVATVDPRKMRLSVARDRDWFSVGGSVTIDEDGVVDMRTLLDRLDHAQGRFVPLGDGRFVALTRQLQAQLQRLNAVSEPHAAGRRVHALGAPALDAVLEEAAQVTADAAWKKHIARIRAAGSYTPAVPAMLQAELRDYQVEGFVWMSRLARWGAGACLADDMGLGKTVQAIAVLLDRAQEGPALVVAPTSVCPNWAAEIARFAPTMRTHRLTDDRAETIAALGPGDVLVCSYGLLNQTAEALAARDWQMVVLDEAQAIKNADTRRAQAVGSLRAPFRLALTGTPVENDLDELWSLFSFVNPGVLGSRESFQKRFGRPIERDRDPAARQALRTLIRPFLLRRTKAAVLSELPPRTEQTMHVPMEDAERTFYEALRRRSLETIAALDAPAGRRRIQILAEITRLRRACCNPALVEPEAGVDSAKLGAFLELVDELILNRHRALVFSQFTSHLALIRSALDGRGIRYEYLDGSTPAAERARRVAAFQAGGTELFLISLRAGGTGLNLTAADYVVHLDPWWNPAVEDQASDRAHRIGQERPVTIYRLVMQDSIEERILQLHRDKRDLAADILEGGEVSARLSEDDLLDLIRL